MLPSHDPIDSLGASVMSSILNTLAGPILAARVLLKARTSVSTNLMRDVATPSGPLCPGSGRMFSTLGLNAEQQQSVQSIRDAALAQIKTFKE